MRRGRGIGWRPGLLVDDERDSLEWVRRLLRECKAEVVVASSANGGLRLVAARAARCYRKRHWNA